MSVRVKCSFCGKALTVKDPAKFGKTIRCPECEEPIRVGKPKSAAGPPSRAARPGAKKRGAKSRQPEPSNNTPLIIGGIAAAVVVVIGVAAVMFMNGGGKDGPNDDPNQIADNGGGGNGGGGNNTDDNESSFVADPLPTAPFGWPSTVDAMEVAWPDEIDLPVTETGWQALFPTASAPYIVTGFDGSDAQGTESWNLIDGQKIGTIQQATPEANLKSLGPKGDLLAINPKGKENQYKVEIWSYKTGQQVAVIDCEQPDRKIEKMTLAANNRLLTFSSTYINRKYERILRLFDMTSKTQLASANFEQSFDVEDAGMSVNGKYIAYLTSQGELLIYDTHDLKRTAFAKFNPPKYSSVGGVAFNADGTKIATLWNGNEKSTIVVVDAQTGTANQVAEFTGSLLYSPLSGEIYMGRGLQWLTDDSGWLVHGRGIVDATSGKLVWLFDSTGPGGNSPRRAVPNGIIAQTGESSIQKRLSLLPIPWETIRSSLAATEANAEARLKQGGNLSLDVQLGEIRFADKNQTKTQVTEAVTKRLKSDQFSVVDNAEVTLKVKYSEAVGKKVAKLGDFRGENAFDSTTAIIKLEWIAKGIDEPILATEMAVSPRLLRVKDSSAQGYRAALFEKALGQLANIPTLSYVATGDNPAMLPGMTIFD